VVRRIHRDMSRAYPIWNQVTACNYLNGEPNGQHQGSKSWGSKDCMTLDQYVGSSISNSEHFCEVVTTRREETDAAGNEIIVFRVSLDGVILKKATFEKTSRGTAGNLVNIKSRLTRLKRAF